MIGVSVTINVVVQVSQRGTRVVMGTLRTGATGVRRWCAGGVPVTSQPTTCLGKIETSSINAPPQRVDIVVGSIRAAPRAFVDARPIGAKVGNSPVNDTIQRGRLAVLLDDRRVALVGLATGDEGGVRGG